MVSFPSAFPNYGGFFDKFELFEAFDLELFKRISLQDRLHIVEGIERIKGLSFQEMKQYETLKDSLLSYEIDLINSNFLVIGSDEFKFYAIDLYLKKKIGIEALCNLLIVQMACSLKNKHKILSLKILDAGKNFDQFIKHVSAQKGSYFESHAVETLKKNKDQLTGLFIICTKLSSSKSAINKKYEAYKKGEKIQPFKVEEVLHFLIDYPFFFQTSEQHHSLNVENLNQLCLMTQMILTPHLLQSFYKQLFPEIVFEMSLSMGFDQNEDLGKIDKRIVQLPFEGLNVPKVIHDFIDSDSFGGYIHDSYYHCLIDLLNPFRKKFIYLANLFKEEKVLYDIIIDRNLPHLLYQEKPSFLGLVFSWPHFETHLLESNFIKKISIELLIGYKIFNLDIFEKDFWISEFHSYSSFYPKNHLDNWITSFCDALCDDRIYKTFSFDELERLSKVFVSFRVFFL
jgi:hypothetical protein